MRSGTLVAMCPWCQDLDEQGLYHLTDAMMRAVQAHIDGPIVTMKNAKPGPGHRPESKP